jgi:hypothetical protein
MFKVTFWFVNLLTYWLAPTVVSNLQAIQIYLKKHFIANTVSVQIKFLKGGLEKAHPLLIFTVLKSIEKLKKNWLSIWYFVKFEDWMLTMDKKWIKSSIIIIFISTKN